ncbi:MAG: hypothetical protein KDC83_01290 [Flavobacteriales bacterium]|nr:hypothetical protein [Flavobacteriales bacterium]
MNKNTGKSVNQIAQFFLFIIIGFLITSCGSEDKPRNYTVSPISLSVERLDLELFDPSIPMIQKNKAASKKYGEFYDRYTENLLNLGSAKDPALVGALKGFTSDPEVLSIFKKIQALYSDFDVIQSELTDAFGRYHSAFPDKVVPTVVTFISGFNTKIVTTDSIVGVGLDLYLGANDGFYELLRYPMYKRAQLSSEFITRDAIYGWLSTEYQIEENDKSFLDAIIKRGKMLYALDCLIPEIHDTIKIGYSGPQLAWASAYEGHFWGVVVDQKILFSTIKGEYAKYLLDGPFTSGLDHNSPPRYGEWLGWQVIKAYMKNNSDISLRQLFELDDAQEILNKSGYKPKKQ